MHNFLVVSYDDDQQQWFYDTVRADDAGDAEEKINYLRPYTIAANATSVAELTAMAKRVKSAKPKAVDAAMDAIAVESGFKTRCQNCQALYREGQLEDISHYSERVGAGEVAPAGQCPAADCGALCHLIPGAE
ncbi:MAG: hypothetical protein WCC97_08375 [Candidatus Acidiferrales bacterium]